MLRPREGIPDLGRRITDAANAATGSRDGLDHLLEQHYDELRHIAHGLMAREAPGNSVEATGLVHLTYQRLLQEAHLTREGSIAFRAAFARVARRILVDRARARHAEKRGGKVQRDELQSVHLAVGSGIGVVELDEVLRKLAELPKSGPRMAAVVEMRVFSDMNIAECALALGVSMSTVRADWRLACGFLRQHLAP